MANMKLIFLGTGAGVPSKSRNVSALVLDLLQQTNHMWLFDCGEATQHQILHTSIKPRKINRIFITHLHGDHIFGLPGFLSSRSFQGGDQPLTIYGPPGIKKYVQTSLSISETHLSYTLHIVEYEEGLIYEDELFKVYCQQLQHGIPSYGFRIEEKDIAGPLLVQKLKEAGIPPSPVYQRLKEQEYVQLEDGRTLAQKDYVGPSQKGKIICILGDTRYPTAHTSFVKHAHTLVHEGTFGHDLQDTAHTYYHSTTTEVATLAKEAQVQHLLLTHISSRYGKEDLPKLLYEARAIFPKTDIVHDFEEYTLS